MKKIGVSLDFNNEEFAKFLVYFTITEMRDILEKGALQELQEQYMDKRYQLYLKGSNKDIMSFEAWCSLFK